MSDTSTSQSFVRLRRLTKRPGALLSAGYLVGLIIMAVFADFLAPHDPRVQNVMLQTTGPSAEHWLGTDALGRDLLSRLIFGARASLGVAVAVVVVALLLAVPIGMIAGFRGGWVDRITMRLVDAGLSVPPIIVALAIAGAMGPGLRNTVLALSLVYLPALVRLTRAEAVSKSSETFMTASISSGTPTLRLLRRRLLPNIASPLFIACSFWLGSALLAEASLSYLGVGVRPPTPSWGGMLREAYNASLFTSAWQLIVPGLAIALTVLAFNVLGEGLRDAFGATQIASGKRGRLGLTTVDLTGSKRSSQNTAPAGESVSLPSGSAGSAANDSAVAKGAPDLDSAGAVLAINDLTVQLSLGDKKVNVVQDLNLAVRPGEIMGLVGESGSGKTVTALSVMRLLPTPPATIVKGAITVNGRDVLAMGPSELRKIRGRDIAMVFQDPMTSLDPSFTIGAQLVKAIRRVTDLNKAEAQSRAIELLEQVQIPSAPRRMKDYPHQLSGGMRQRVALAIALAGDPKLLIADEPTTALDATIQAQILELLHDLRRRYNMAILFVTHDLGVVADLCDRVAVMYAGQIVEVNDVTELFEAPSHPYTEGLLASMPRLDRVEDTHLRVIPGRVPPPVSFPHGCRFAARCSYCEDACTATPITLTLGPDAAVRCRRSDELELVGVQAGAVPGHASQFAMGELQDPTASNTAKPDDTAKPDEMAKPDDTVPFAGADPSSTAASRNGDTIEPPADRRPSGESNGVLK